MHVPMHPVICLFSTVFVTSMLLLRMEESCMAECQGCHRGVSFALCQEQHKTSPNTKSATTVENVLINPVICDSICPFRISPREVQSNWHRSCHHCMIIDSYFCLALHHRHNPPIFFHGSFPRKKMSFNLVVCGATDYKQGYVFSDCMRHRW